MRLGIAEIEAIRRTRSYRSAIWQRRGVIVLVPLVVLSRLNTTVLDLTDWSVLPVAVADFLAHAEAMFLGSAFVLGVTSFYLLQRAGIPVERSRRRSDPLRITMTDPLSVWAIAQDTSFGRRGPLPRLREPAGPLTFEPLSSPPRTRRTPPAAG